MSSDEESCIEIIGVQDDFDDRAWYHCSHPNCGESFRWYCRIMHESNCNHRRLKCPVANCKWIGKVRFLRDHIRDDVMTGRLRMDQLIDLELGTQDNIPSFTLSNTKATMYFIVVGQVFELTIVRNLELVHMTHYGNRDTGDTFEWGFTLNAFDSKCKLIFEPLNIHNDFHIEVLEKGTLVENLDVDWLRTNGFFKGDNVNFDVVIKAKAE